MESYILVSAFFIIALIYSSVGFGGGSSYLALLAQPFFALLPETIKPIALLCNIVVVTGGVIIFYRKGELKWKEIWPFLVLSVPAAFIGGYWRLKERTFFILLGITLLLAAIFLWIKPKQNVSKELSLTTLAGLGGGIGLLSGLVSIGGGIFLSPILHLINWSTAKKISALASAFILVNSISGLVGYFSAGGRAVNWGFAGPLLLAVFVGGQIGSRLGSQVFNAIYIRRITAIVILVAAVNILRDHL
ncbi:MAG TPA: sulfite exporter TauE/SafE family protein [Cyclobacteriaceae bacterium]|nr:sulfite exporter TauE/SafE family protein [Cyclobacteriaceae bacterium]